MFYLIYGMCYVEANESFDEIVCAHDDGRNVKTVAIPHPNEYVNGINGRDVCSPLYCFRPISLKHAPGVWSLPVQILFLLLAH